METSIGVLDTTLKTNIFKEEQQEWQEFQGRFFVKILSDIVTDEYLESQIGTIVSSTLAARTELFYVSDRVAPNDGSSAGNVNGSGLFQGLYGTQNMPSDSLSPENAGANFISDLPAEWKDEILHFNKGETSGGWFIDSAFSIAQQPTILTDTSGWTNTNAGANIYDASISGMLRKSSDNSANGMTGFIETDNFYCDSTNAGHLMWLKQF